jgi:hypothetical protein
MPETLRRRLSALSQSTTGGFFPGLERMQAEQLTVFLLRVFASRALRSVGLEYEARECELAQEEPLDAAYAASRAELDITCVTSERCVEDFEAVAQVVAVNAAQAYWRAMGETDLLVPVAGDHAAVAVLAWELPFALSRINADLDWVGDATAAVSEESRNPLDNCLILTRGPWASMANFISAARRSRDATEARRAGTSTAPSHCIFAKSKEDGRTVDVTASTPGGTGSSARRCCREREGRLR